jgi:hypothetical protein
MDPTTNQLVPSPPCCEAWTDFAPSIEWFDVVDLPGTLVLPSIGFHLIKHCPFCGASTHGRVTTRSALKWIDKVV